MTTNLEPVDAAMLTAWRTKYALFAAGCVLLIVAGALVAAGAQRLELALALAVAAVLSLASCWFLVLSTLVHSELERRGL